MREKTGGLGTGEGRFDYYLKTHNMLLQGKICNNYLRYYIFFSGYVTSMSKCLEFKAHLQCSTGKSDLTCLFYPQLETPNTFLLPQNPATVSVTLWSNVLHYTVEHSYTLLLQVLLVYAA